MIAKLKEKAKTLPLSPGVYLMKDSTGRIIYVGKAKRLKQRIQSYFQHSKNHSTKVVKLIKQIDDFDFILTDTEFEAFLLECQLIKNIQPFFNSMMKNPQSYVYITITKMERLPEITITDIPDERTYYCFGPYTSKSTVKKAIEGMKEAFHIQCSNPSSKSSFCLNYSLGLCIGMCGSKTAVEQYREIIGKIIALLSGTDTSLLTEMEEKMADAAENYHFEEAKKWRDWIKAIQSLLNKEQVIQFTEKNNKIIVTEFLSDETLKLFLIQRNKMIFSRKYTLNHVDYDQLKNEIKTCFMANSAQEMKKMSRDEIDEAQIIYYYLKRGGNHYCIIPDEWLQPEYDRLFDDQLLSLFEKKTKI